MQIIYKRFGVEREKSITFWRDDIFGLTPRESLQRLGFQIETKELRHQYLQDIKEYSKITPQIGKQFVANGGGVDDILDDEEDDHRRYRHTSKGKSYPFKSQRIIIDVFMENDAAYEELKHDNHVENGSWLWSRIGGAEKVNEDEDDGDEYEYAPEEQNVEIPIHPHVVVFDLVRHIRLSTHVMFLTEYIYDKKLSEKLVIPNEVKELIEMLVDTKKSGFKDIVKGKSGGTVMLLSGDAGTGKTLTAEVFSEYQEKPLYNVQASQLGLNPEELETELKRVLKRAARWNAILLIDEADVYVHKRENNLEQNAIVGVFLRVLEYHDATIFLTTNRPDIVDDAIISRCVASIEYQYPTEEQQTKIWNIICKTSNTKISENVIRDFVHDYHNYSGRDIKNLIKLSNYKSTKEEKPITVEMIKFVSKFNPSIKKASDDDE